MEKTNTKRVRYGCKDDLERMAEILYSCYNADPLYPYRYPHAMKDQGRMNDYMQLCRQKCYGYLRDSSVWVFDVCEKHHGENSVKLVWKLVAFSVWKGPEGSPHLFLDPRQRKGK
jgi:hypothetical protein